MRKHPKLIGALCAALTLAGIVQAQASEPFYNPANTASTSGKTTGHELYKTIGCPGRAMLDAPCPVPAPAKAAAP
ncbi:MAG: hypothetical protein MUE86_03735, partial [Thiobacillaceae bacterium]|nr:hypothetical protein [Thiobacillaceae bacterium]